MSLSQNPQSGMNPYNSSGAGDMSQLSIYQGRPDWKEQNYKPMHDILEIMFRKFN